MGKKSAKGKEKKLRRLEETKKQTEAVRIVQEANEIEKPFDALKPFHSYTKNDLKLRLSCKFSNELTTQEFDTLFNLVEHNMKTLYEQSNWGWNEKEKKDEMKEDFARYLIVENEKNEIVAMTHFRFDVEDCIEVVYCYEIQLRKDIRGKGLGKFMMQILELLAIKVKMQKVILTVFKANCDAVRFFTNLKYVMDETCPRLTDPNNAHEYDYEILSKSLKR